MELQQAIENRRSIRKYKKDKVERKLIDEIIQAAIFAPSWKNSQVTHYYIVDSEEMLEKIKGTLPEFNYNNCKDAPVIIVSGIKLNDAGFNPDGSPTNELGNGWGYYDCGLQAMNLCLKAQELGLGTLIMGIRDTDRIKELLSIDETIGIVSVIALGYPDIDPKMPKRKSINDVATYF